MRHLRIPSIESHKLKSARNAVLGARNERTKTKEEEEEGAHFGKVRGAETSLLSAVIVPHMKNARDIYASDKNSFRSRKA